MSLRPPDSSLQNRAGEFSPDEPRGPAAGVVDGLAFAPAAAEDPARPALCLFTDSLDPSGVGEHMLVLARALGPSWRITFACPRGEKGDPFLERARAQGLQVLALNLEPDGLPSLEALRGWLSRNPGALFHAHAGIGWEGHHAIYMAREAGCAIVRTEHLPYLITFEPQVEDHRRLLDAVDLLVCVSHAARDSFLGRGLDMSCVRAVRNGIDPSLPPANPTAARHNLLRELRLPSSARILLTVGRFTEQKGHEHLLDALPLLDSARPDERAYLLWVGQGEDRDRLRARACELGLEDRVLFLGQRRDIAALMLAADAFVLPSLFEGLPLAALEAMAAGVPIVGTRVCGTEEAIGGEQFGWLVPKRDPKALAEALAQVLARPGEAARRAERARQRVRRDFTAERMARETERVYHEALAMRAGAST